MQQAHIERHGPSARDVVTSAASTSASAALVGSLFDLTYALRRGHADPAATVPILTRLVVGGPLRSCDLAQQLHLDQSTVSRHVAALTADGLVRRTPQEDDRRALLIEVTDEGRAAARSRITARVQQFESAVADWPQDDVATFARLLNAFVAGLDAQERNHK